MFDFLLGHDLLSAIIAFCVVLIPAVLAHEFGHFIAAKLVGITVLEFGIGFPPRIRKLFTWQETEFTLNWLPLGGFVRPLGEDMARPLGEEETERAREELVEAKRKRQELIANRLSDAPGEKERKLATLLEKDMYRSEREELAARGIYHTVAVNECAPWPRMFFMVAGAFANFIFAFLIFVFIGLIDMPTEVGVKVGLSLVPADSSLAEAGLREGDVITMINGEYFATTRELFERLAAARGTSVTLHIQRRETDEAPTVEFNLALTPAEDIAALLAEAHDHIVVVSIEEGSPAHAAGLQPDDLIVAFNGENLVDVPDAMDILHNLTDAAAGQLSTLTVLRNEELVDAHLIPRTNPPPSQGRMGIGIVPGYVTPDWRYYFPYAEQYVTRPQSPGVALEYGAERTARIFKLIAEFPGRLLSDDTEPEERRILSPVGVSQIGGDILQESIEEEEPAMILDYIALISIALGVTNLLPIPAFDGGRIIFVILEIIRGKPIAPEREGLVHLMGLLFLLTIGVFFIINDIVNPLTNVVP